MTDTQWLLDLVEEATPRPWTVGSYEVFSPASKAPLKRIAFVHEWMNVSDARLIALAPDLARLCVEQHEALSEATTCEWIEGATDGQNAELKRRGEAIRAAVARFKELKP